MVVAFVLCLSAFPLIAQPTGTAYATAETLKLWCQGKGAVRATCHGFLMGVVDALRHPDIHDALMARIGQTVCLPVQLKPEQVRLIFLGHIHNESNAGERRAADQVWEALRRAFPCASKEEPAKPSSDVMS